MHTGACPRRASINFANLSFVELSRTITQLQADPCSYRSVRWGSRLGCGIGGRCLVYVGSLKDRYPEAHGREFGLATSGHYFGLNRFLRLTSRVLHGNFPEQANDGLLAIIPT